MPVAFASRMRVQVTPCERYRLRVTTWGSGAPPHAVVLPGLSADWRALAPQIRTLRRLGWTVHVVDLPGFALHPSLRAADANVVPTTSRASSRRSRSLGRSCSVIRWAAGSHFTSRFAGPSS